jgi:hypothetical protein
MLVAGRRGLASDGGVDETGFAGSSARCRGSGTGDQGLKRMTGPG